MNGERQGQNVFWWLDEWAGHSSRGKVRVSVLADEKGVSVSYCKVGAGQNHSGLCLRLGQFQRQSMHNFCANCWICFSGGSPASSVPLLKNNRFFSNICLLLKTLPSQVLLEAHIHGCFHKRLWKYVQKTVSVLILFPNFIFQHCQEFLWTYIFFFYFGK